MPPVDQSCKSCAFLMGSESSETQYRCGHDYYSKPPSTRHPEKMTAYKQVNLTHRCVNWQQHSPSILRDKFL